MSLSRRRFVQSLGIGAAGALTSSLIGARGREGSLFGFDTPVFAADPKLIILSSNENPMGPGKMVLDAVRASFGEGGRAPGRYPFGNVGDLTSAVAAKFGIKDDNVLLGTGSTQILRTATHVFTSKTRPLVGTIPTYEECSGYATLIGSPVRGVKLDSAFRMDLDLMASAAKGAGLIFYCNPNNPTATAVGGKTTRDFIAQVLKDSPETTVLIDEAYFDYATDPAYETMIPLAIDNPRVVVARTFSKAYGMAGLRIGYAVGRPETLRKMAEWDATGSVNVLAIAGALAAIGRNPEDLAAERARNNEARAFAMKWFSDRGYTPTDSQANFMFVNIKRPAKEFREACRAQGVVVARDFPPFEKTHCRISVGTLDEMRQAVQVFDKVLAVPAKAAA